MINEPLVDRNSILLPPLHMKLGLMKQFVKALDKMAIASGTSAADFLVRVMRKLEQESLTDQKSEHK